MFLRGPDIYQTIPLRVPADRDLVIAGLEFRPGNRRVVHHSRIHLDVTVRKRSNRREGDLGGAAQRESSALAGSTRARSSCPIRG